MDTSTIRTRITTQGWQLREIPIKRSHPDPKQRTVLQWKLVAIRGNRSIETGKPSLDEAMKSMGQMLGVIPRDKA